MIPKTIHCCWFGGASMPNETREYISSWKDKNPAYQLIIWSEDNFDFDVNQYAREALIARKWAFVSDYARLKVLYDYGGIYLDTDVEAIKSFDSLLSYHAFAGFESPDSISTGVIGAERGNPWIDLLLKDYDTRKFVLGDGSFDTTTNVTTVTRLTTEHYPLRLDNEIQDLGDFVMLPFDYLCAKDLATGEIKITPNTCTVHHYAGSWLPPKQRFIKRVGEVIGPKALKSLVALKHRFEGRTE